MTELQRIRTKAPRPHTWAECFPIIVSASSVDDLSDFLNQTVRRIFRKLPQHDRIKFHQATCESRISPAHDAVILKIQKRVEEALRLYETQELLHGPETRTD